jgi:hypothetical protein
MLRSPRLVGDEIWYRIPGTNRLIPGLPAYSPDSIEWRELLGKKKILPQAALFLPDVGNWLQIALSSLLELNAIQKSDLITAAALVSLIGSLGAEFGEQRHYLLRHDQHLQDSGTDPKWLAKPGNQARFVADSMAGARWGLTISSSREMIRTTSDAARRDVFKKLQIPLIENWWMPRDRIRKVSGPAREDENGDS